MTAVGRTIEWAGVCAFAHANTADANFEWGTQHFPPIDVDQVEIARRLRYTFSYASSPKQRG